MPSEGRDRYRVLLGKPGLDGHNKGIHLIQFALRDAGFEVIYLGLRSTPSEIARAAVDEDVDCVGLSVLSGAHRTLFPSVRHQLDEYGGQDIPLIGGGIIPDVDHEWLRQHEVAAIFGPGTTLDEVVHTIRTICADRRKRIA